MSKLSYSEIEKLFNGISQRERFILFGALIICSISITYFWVLDPAFITQASIEKQLQKSVKQKRALNSEITQVKQKLQQDPIEEINNKINFSQGILKSLDKRLDDKLFKFIHAQKMPIALTKVLAKTPGVKIKALKSLPVKIFNTSKQSNSESGNNQNIFYQHTLEITIQGDYNAIYQYLLNVESLPEKLYWYSLDYQVSDYPVAQVTIQIYTLSDQQDLVSG